jgi:multiple sugar transport system permease protein
MKGVSGWSRQRQAIAYWMILPAVAAMLLVHYIPMLWGFYISMHDVNLFTMVDWINAPFVGFRNFIDGFNPATTTGARALKALWNITVYSVVAISAGYVIGLAVAILLNQDFLGRTLMRGLILLPYITPDCVAFNVWKFIFQSRIGLLNRYLVQWNLVSEPPIWLVGPPALWAVTIASIWKGWPFAALILLAALQKIPPELYEAARVDGATAWQQFTMITIPQLRTVSVMLILMSILWNFNAFNQFFIMLGRDPGIAAEVPSTLILREAFTNLKYGIGSALSIVLMLILLVITTVYLYALRGTAGAEEI